MRFIWGVSFVIMSAVTLWNCQADDVPQKTRSFTVDYENDRFLKDGEPFRYVAGSFHYFRALPQTWERKLRTMRAAGLVAVTTYVEWSLHNPKDGVYEWSGIANLVRFIQLATKQGLLVILRPGPYICAERDNGGFPYWLFRKYPGIKLRTSDANYLAEVRKWYGVLMPKMKPYFYGNGGSIIMVQIENEYGSFSVCDKRYQMWLKNETYSYVRDKAVLFTNDGPTQTACGKIPGVLATLDFGSGTNRETDSNWTTLRIYQPKGPLVNSEYYPGWLTHWQENFQRVSTEKVIPTFEHMMNQSANVNFYVFFGGTNFGFTTGANDGGYAGYNPVITSYDYDAPMDESGDPTSKYWAIRDSIGKYFPLPSIPLPTRQTKIKLPSVKLTAKYSLLSSRSRENIGVSHRQYRDPPTFEALDQNCGFVLYETNLGRLRRDPSLLTILGLRDRAHVLVDGKLKGILSRQSGILSMPINDATGWRLQILVECEGRINFNIANDTKGIIGNVILNNQSLSRWDITGYPLEDSSKFQFLEFYEHDSNEDCNRGLSNAERLTEGPILFAGNFTLKYNQIRDTYINPVKWGKGIIYVNGFNLGRYWPLGRPQITLYLPKEVLRLGRNTLIVLELQRAPEDGLMYFSDTAKLDA